MELTVKIDSTSPSSATLVERHALVAGDNYNPLNFDFSALTPTQLASIDLNTMSIVVRKLNAGGTILASSNLFSNATQTSSGGTATVLPKVKKTSLLLNTQAVKDWFDSVAGSSSPDFQQTVYVELSDSGMTYIACTMPFILRSFTVGSTSTGYYTKSEVDSLLAGKQSVVTATSPLAKSAQNVLSVGLASSGEFGVMKVGNGLSASNGVVSVVEQTTTVDTTLDSTSTNPIQNKPVAEAVSGVVARLDDILKTTGGVESGRLKVIETALSSIPDGAEANVQSDWNQTDTTADDYIKNKPSIPSSDAIGNKWYSGTGVTGTSTDGAIFSGSGVATASVGDMYLNGSTGNVYRCTTPGIPSVAVWSYSGCIKGSTGSAGPSGKIAKTYASVTAMQSDFETSTEVGDGELVMINTGSVNDEDTGKIYRKDTASFTYVGDISGPRGTQLYSGSYLTYSGSTVSKGNSPDFAYANVGDKYINTGTNGGLFSCTTAGNGTDSAWTYVGTVNGPQGSPGSPGAAGAAGADGTKWIVGTAVDLTHTSSASSGYTGLANVGDIYLNTSERALYKCTTAKTSDTDPNAVWAFASYFGKDGTDGTDGTAWLVGSDHTAYTGNANEGDLYLNTTSGKVYEWTDEGSSPVQRRWVERATLKGPSGNDGSSGVQTYVGSSAPASASDGDLFFNTTSGQVSRYSSGNWTVIVSACPGSTEYDTIYVPASSMTPKTSNGTTAGVITIGTNNTPAPHTAPSAYDTQSFAGGSSASDKTAEFSVAMPDSWDAGTVKVKVLWTALSGSAGAGVRFSLSASCYSDDSSLATYSPTSVNVDDSLLAVNDLHKTSASPQITVSGATAGGLVHFRISRDADYNAGSGILSSDVHVIGAVIQYSRSANQQAW